MIPRAGYLVACVAALTLAGCASRHEAASVSAFDRFELFVGGGIAGTGPNLSVTLDANGVLTAHWSGLPIVPPGKLTEREKTLHLKKESAKRLLSLALAAEDFDQGCQEVADGTTAHLRVLSQGKAVERECQNASGWPTGPKAKRFFEELERVLPKACRLN